MKVRNLHQNPVTLFLVILLLIIFTISLIIVNSSLLVLLILANEIVHVTLSLGELHLVHTLASIPMKESFPPEHGSKLLRDSLKELLDGSGIVDESGGHLKTPWWNIANSSLDVIGNPFDKVAAILILDVEHLLIHLLHGHPTPEHGSHGEIPAMSRVTGSHHVLGVEHLLGQLGDSQSPVLLCTTGSEGSKPGGMKKWSLGKGAMFTASFLKSEFSCPGNLRHVVTPDMVRDTRWFRSP